MLVYYFYKTRDGNFVVLIILKLLLVLTNNVISIACMLSNSNTVVYIAEYVLFSYICWYRFRKIESSYYYLSIRIDVQLIVRTNKEMHIQSSIHHTNISQTIHGMFSQL